MEARALYKFESSQSDELTFKAGDILKVRNMEDKDWYQAELGGKVGMVPAKYLQMDDHDWYKGQMKREEAEAFLMQSRKSGQPVYQDGAFIIRDCQSAADQFSLSVKHGSGCQHFKILIKPSDPGKYHLWPNKDFTSINKLIEYHRTTSVARDPHTHILLRDLQQTKIYQALFDFMPESPEEVPFRCGDRIQLIAKEDENWWTGEVMSTKKQGLFPCNYVKEV